MVRAQPIHMLTLIAYRRASSTARPNTGCHGTRSALAPTGIVTVLTIAPSRRDPCVVGQQQVSVVDRRLDEPGAAWWRADAAHRSVGDEPRMHRARSRRLLEPHPARRDRCQPIGFVVETHD